MSMPTNNNTLPGSNTKVDSNGNYVTTFNTYSANMEIQYANNYHIQNEMLKKMRESQSTNASKVNYLKIDSYNLNWYNGVFFIIYCVLVLIFIAFSFIGRKMMNMSIYLKICICITFILFPFFITRLEILFMYLFNYILNLFNGTPYIHPNY
jgi:lipopolysaccharide export LptBFGC system permease protein LptF